MICRDALALARRGRRAEAEPHLAGCAACRDALRLEERALDVARQDLAIEPPAGHAARVARAALAAPAAPRPWPRPWWDLALPVAWRAALAANLVGAAVLAWALLRDRPAPRDELDVLDAEASEMLTRALGLDAEATP